MSDDKDPTLVITASPECLANMALPRTGRTPDFTVTSAKIAEMGEGYLEIDWETKSAGFGVLTLYRTPEGELRCDDETMGRKFVREVLLKLGESLALDSDS